MDDDSGADGNTRRPRFRLGARWTVVALIVSGVLLIGWGSLLQMNSEATNADLEGRIVARCLHNMPIPVGDEMSSRTVIEICAMTPDGQILGRLPDRASSVDHNGLAISPNGLQLAYRVSTDADGERPVVIIDLATGTVSARLDTSSPGYSGDVSWSSDGASLLFVDSQDVFVQSIDGEESTRYRVVDEPDGFALGTASMSPDGAWIAVAADGVLMLIAVATGEQRQVGSLEPWAYAWSAHNDLAVVRTVDASNRADVDGKPGEVVIVDPVTLTISEVLEIDDVTSQPAWSPEGDLLFVTDRHTGWFIEPRAEIGERVRRETRFDTGLLNPAWSPDGSAVVAQTSGDGSAPFTSLVIVDATTGKITPLPHDAVAGGSIGSAQAAWVPGDWTWEGLATTWPAQDPPIELDE